MLYERQPEVVQTPSCEAFGATVQYLPQYSPDLNPIEMPFSKFKAFLRKVSERTVRGLCRRIGSFMPTHQSCRMSQLLQTCRLTHFAARALSNPHASRQKASTTVRQEACAS
jgi:DDE superfamily endonuclease